MDRGQLRAAVRVELQEPTQGFWKDVDLNTWIQDACDDLVDAAELEAAPSTITTANDDEDYALPADFGRVRRLELVEDEKLTRLHAGALDDRVGDKGKPLAYAVWNATLYVIPKADDAYTLKLWYYKVANTLAVDADVPNLPARYHRLITLYVTSQAQRMAGDNAFTTYSADYNAGREQMMRERRRRSQQDRNPVVIDDDEGFE